MSYDEIRKNISETIAEKVNSFRWVHQIDLGNGIVTPGRWPPHPLILQAFDSLNFAGKKVLDIGCWDGLWSFEAEQRGASEVFATDYISQRSYNKDSTFEFARETLNSRVKYYPQVSVYNIESLQEDEFDIVIFCGIYYHLRDPLKALALLRKVMKNGGTLIIEGGALFGTDQCFAKFCYRDWHANDPSNWWVPSISCLRQWIQSSYFDLTDEFTFAPESHFRAHIKNGIQKLLNRPPLVSSRVVITARATTRKDPNYMFPDDDFRDFDLNEYGIDRG